MKKLHLLLTSILSVCLMLCICAGNGLSVRAAGMDTDEMLNQLGKAFGISKSDFDNYNSDYAKSLPIEYKQTSTSMYVALGCVTAGGIAGISDPANSYADKLAETWGIDYDNRADTQLRPADTAMYISRQRSAIKKADLITFQNDGSELLLEAMDMFVQEYSINWSKYVSDPSFVNYINDFKAQMVAEYSPQYGKANAESVSLVLEYILYECVVYGVETMNAVNTIRTNNANATILIIGLYNPLRNLSLTADGKTIDIGYMVGEMLEACNVYLLSKTKNMNKVGFIDVSDTDTNGFGNVVLNLSNSDALTNQLYQIIGATDKQYANQKGHDKIRDRILNALAEPCEHTQTTTKGAKTASCKEEGYTGDTVCSKCGIILKSGSVIAKKAHSYGAWKVTKAPTCIEKGEETRTCTSCSTQKETREIAATNKHTYDNGKVTTKPDCDTKGVKTYSCTNAGCNHKKTEDIAATGHKLDTGKVTTAPDCDTKGVKTYSCTNSGCDYKKTEEIAATGHKLDNGKVTTKPGCETKGVKTYSCTNSGCDYEKTEEIAAVGHKWDNGEIVQAPECETEGKKTVTCTVCNKSENRVIPATGHAWDEGSVTTEPGCETEGEKAVTCTVCGKADVETIPAVGHDYGDYVSNNDATCEKDGTKTAVCANCGEKDTVEDPESKTEHIYEDGYCVTCKAEQPKQPSNKGLWITLAVAVPLLGAGGVAGFFVYRKKKSIK